MKIKYIFILIVFSLFFNLTFINQSKAEENTEVDQFTEDLGFNCGYPNTESSQCCLTKGSTGEIDEESLNRTINKLKDCTLTKNQIENSDALSTCINDQEANIIISLINSEKNDDRKALISYGIENYILSQNNDKKTNFVISAPFIGSVSIGDIETFLKSQRVSYNTLPYSEKLKIETANAIPRDKCIINVLGAKTLCFKGIAQFFAGIIGDNPKIQAALEANKIQNDACIFGKPDTKNGNCICVADTSLSKLCKDYITNDQEYNRCVDCSENKFGFWTGLGCINLSFSGFVQETLFGWALGLAGIITLLCIIYAAFMLQTSSGNPERIKKARQYLTACITGLLLIIFSVLILRIIGVEILKIPGFNKF